MDLDLPYTISYASSGLSKCKSCFHKIKKGELRIAKRVQSQNHDGDYDVYYHINCIYKRQNEHPSSVNEISQLDTIRWKDKKIVERIIENHDFMVEYAKSDRSKCKKCYNDIPHKELRVSKKYYNSDLAPSINRWYHLDCFVNMRSKLGFFDDGIYLPGFDALTDEDKKIFKRKLSKIDAENLPPAPKKTKMDLELQNLLKKQNEEFFELKDKLEDLKAKDVRKLFEVNKIYIGEKKPKSDQSLNILADAMLFGVIEPCTKSKCQGTRFLYISGIGYKCTKVFNYNICQNVVPCPKRKEFIIPESLKRVFSFYKSSVRERLFQRRNLPELSTSKLPLKKEDNNQNISNEGYVKDVKKVSVKSGTVVDPKCRLKNVHVYKDKEDIYTATLVRTIIEENKNSYYIMQILKHDKEEKYWLFRRWGRIGCEENGGIKSKRKTLETCKDNFEKIYEEKTGRMFGFKEKFEKLPGKMYHIRTEDGNLNSDDYFQSPIASKLEKSLQDLIKLMFDRTSMKETILQYKISASMMPLGVIAEEQINEAKEVLVKLWQLIIANCVADLEYTKLSNEFYTLIPHDFGRELPCVIRTRKDVEIKFNMLDSLLDMGIAYDILHTKIDENKNPLDFYYKKLKTDVKPLSKESEEFELIEKYVKNTHGETHKFKLIIDEAFVIKRRGEERKYKPFKKFHNRKLLWHGSKTTNFVGILSQGLRIAPPEVPSTGYFFGKGIYFADMVSKSAQYCGIGFDDEEIKNDTILLLLCEVALGNMDKRYDSDYIEKLPDGVNSIWGCGEIQPDPEKSVKLKNGVEVPCGPKILAELEQKSKLVYNEFIVYDEAQVNLKYLVKLNRKKC